MPNAIHKHAKHLACIHISCGNPKAAASALESMPPIPALEFLFNLANTYRIQNKTDRVQTTLDVANLIKRSRDLN